MFFLQTIGDYFRDFISLMYPNLCVSCDNNLIKGEEVICMDCLQKLPKTNLHLVKDNILEKRFWGKADIYMATAYFYYTKDSIFQSLLHDFKYKNKRDIGVVLAKYAASQMFDVYSRSDIDFIVPVPLHINKYRKRGYNQSRLIADGLSEILSIPVNDNNLYRSIENPTQTKKSTYDRWLNTDGIFDLHHPSTFENKHILLVDDVLTTGSTIIACEKAIHEKSNTKVSVFTLAAAI